MKIRPILSIFAFIFVLIFSFCMFSTVSAAPAAPIDHTLTQPDGSTFTARQWGDEWSNGFETIEGFTILQTQDGWWAFAELAADGKLVPVLEGEQPVLVGEALSTDIPLHVRPMIESSGQTLRGVPVERSSNIGTQPTLVLLASFSDRPGTYPFGTFANSIFGATNSVKDYYLKASFNQLTLAPAAETHGTTNDGVVGWLPLGYNHPNTGVTTSSDNQLIVKNALIAADSYVNYASFDTNSDGFISINELHLVVVVAGFERAYSDSSPSVWAHSWNLYNVTPPTLDGKVLGDPSHNGSYAQFGEIHENHQATIGIMAHELGHDITWPDLYDTDQSSEGVGKWSIMGSGNWNYVGSNYAGSSPALPDAWLKWYQGWITPTPVSGTQTGVSIPTAATSASAFLLGSNPNNVDWEFYVKSGVGEYFLVENKQLTSYDAGLPGCGLLIWHIDESVTSTNSANANENRPLVKLMEADGLNDLYNGTDRGDAGDPFPGTTTNRTFDYYSNPNSRLYSGADSLVSVTSISNCAATMTANLTYSAVNLPPTNINLSKSTILEGQPVNTVVGTFSTVDPNAGDTFTYSLVPGTGDVNNASFNISGSSLRTSAVFDYNVKSTYSIRVRSTDNGGLSTEKSFTITVLQFGGETFVYLPLIMKGGFTDPIINGGFELGHVGWSEYTKNNYFQPIVTQAFAQLYNSVVSAHSGSWLVWLGGSFNEINSISQTISIPASGPYLHYWYWIGSEDVCGYDYFRIKLGTTTVHTKNLCQTTNTGGWVQGVLDLSVYAGSSVSLKFEVTTDSSLNSNLFLDDVFFSTSSTAAPDLILPDRIDPGLDSRPYTP